MNLSVSPHAICKNGGDAVSPSYCENPFKANIFKNTDNPWILAKGTKPLTLFTPLTEL